jgi:hypothetical protein
MIPKKDIRIQRPFKGLFLIVNYDDVIEIL